MTPDLAFNTAVSFMTGTSWQSYPGESTLSYLSQMLGIAVQSFTSTAAGMAVAVAVVRGFMREKAHTLGNFWVDLTRCTVYILIPISFFAGLALCSLGVDPKPAAIPGSHDDRGTTSSDPVWAGRIPGIHQASERG